jgi:hypothetical protein
VRDALCAKHERNNDSSISRLGAAPRAQISSAELCSETSTNLHVEDAGGGIVDPAVNNGCADVVNARVVVVLDPLGHLSELQISFRKSVSDTFPQHRAHVTLTLAFT